MDLDLSFIILNFMMDCFWRNKNKLSIRLTGEETNLFKKINFKLFYLCFWHKASVTLKWVIRSVTAWVWDLKCYETDPNLSPKTISHSLKTSNNRFEFFMTWPTTIFIKPHHWIITQINFVFGKTLGNLFKWLWRLQIFS